MPYEETLVSRELDTALRGVACAPFEAKVTPSSFASQQVGNCYTGAVFVNLVSLVCEVGAGLEGKRIGMFSYGSGSVASLYSFIGRDTSNPMFTLANIQSIGVFDRLATRSEATAQEFAEAMAMREQAYGKTSYEPQGAVSAVAPGAFYLVSVNELHHRTYSRVPQQN